MNATDGQCAAAAGIQHARSGCQFPGPKEPSQEFHKTDTAVVIFDPQSDVVSVGGISWDLVGDISGKPFAETDEKPPEIMPEDIKRAVASADKYGVKFEKK